MSSTTSDSVAKYLEGLDWPRRGRTQNTVIRAGAGAGKTTELVARVLSLALKFRHDQQRFPRLVVTTFTRKATQELKERLLAAALKTEDEEILRYIQQSRSLQVSTIHGSLQRFLMLHGSVVGLSPDFRIIEDREYHWLRGKVLRRLIEEDVERAKEAEILLEGWSIADFWNAFEAWEEVTLLHPGAKAETAADVEKAREQMLTGFERKLQRYLESFGEHKLTAAWQEYESILQSLLSAGFSKDSLEKLSLYREAWDNAPSVRVLKSMDETFKSLHVEIKDDFDALSDYRWSADFQQKLELCLPAFESLAQNLSERLSAAKMADGVLAKSDLEFWTLKILRAAPERGEQFGKSWDYWMIDEFQDTSPVQVEILSALAGSEGRGFYVGDPQQSIYLFRGARSEVFFEREAAIEKMQGEHLLLMKNYRSAPPLMSFLNDFLPNFSPQFAPMESGGKEREWSGPQALFWQVPKLDPKLTETPEVGATDADPKKVFTPAVVGESAEERAEDLAVLARIQELLASGAEASSICVLSRNNENLRSFAKLAGQKGLPFHWGGDASFADRTEIRDALCLMKFLAQPHDNLNLLSLLRSPWFLLEDAEIQEFATADAFSYYKNWRKLFEAEKLSVTSEKLFTELSGCLREAQHRGISPVWLSELLKRKFVDRSYALDPSGRRESNFWKLIAELRFEEREAGFNLLGFIEKLEDSRSARDSEDEDAPAVEEPSRVQLMTIHASKGLQFGHVILGWAGRSRFATNALPLIANEKTGAWSLGFRGDEDGVLKNSPWGLSEAKEKLSREIAEFDRFLYVALTRAKLTVSLLWGDGRMMPQAWPSRWSLGIEEGITEKSGYRMELRRTFPELTAFTRETQSGGAARKPWRELNTVKLRDYISVKRPEWLRFDKIQEGVRIHRWMEALKTSWDRDFDPKIEALKAKLEAFEEVDLRQLIEGGEVEWSFMVKKGQEWIPGRIDFWGKDADGKIWVLDYKTGSARYREKALLQLKIYTWALHQLGQIPDGAEVRLLPLFLFSEGSKSEKAPSRQELEAGIDDLMKAFRG